jgi:hypothetical protein
VSLPLIAFIILTYTVLVLVAHIVSRADTEDLMLFYNLPAFSKGDTDAFLSGLARSNGMVKKVRVYLPSSEADGVS